MFPNGGVARWVPAWLRPVRVRLTLLATMLLALALAVAALIMLLVLYSVLLNSADSATTARADQIARSITENGLSGVDESLLVPIKDIDVVQVIDADGRVVAANSGADFAPLVGPLGASHRATIDGAHLGDDEEEYRATAIGVATSNGATLTVAVGAAETPLRRVVITVATIFTVVFPVVLFLLAGSTYYFVGRALRPVERIRAQVDEISGGDLHRRVPIPQTGDEIATLATTMNQMLGRIERARDQQLRFVGDASHELRSPLVTLVGLLDLASSTQQAIDPETVDALLMPEAVRLQQMVDDLLLLARSDERGIPLTVVDVDLDDVVSNEVMRLEALSNHHITFDMVPTRVRGDLNMLVRAVRNIADNANRHAKQRLSFGVSADHQAATVIITDDGPGIDPSDRVRVFERFVRLDADRHRASGGSGLGLAIVSEVVRAHGGRVWIESAAGGGTTVGFSVPIAGSSDAHRRGSPPFASSK